MKFPLLFLLALLNFPRTVVAHAHAHEHEHERHLEEEDDSGVHRCGTALPTLDDFLARDHADQFLDFLQARDPGFRERSVIVPVCFHIPQSERNEPSISNEDLQNELDHLNRAFTNSSCCDTELEWCSGECSLNTGISFVMATLDAYGNVNGTTNSTSDPTACITRPTKRRWMRVNVSFKAIYRREDRMKRALRKGDESVLNVYYTSIFTRFSFKDGLLGYSTFPRMYAREPKLDGVVINRNAIRGGSLSNYNEGDTLVHEVGHWMGLFHTFQGSCSRGDQVSDTAPEKSANSGCSPEKKRDSCPGDEKLDPIFNFMDYSYDSCMYEFTPGQIRAMLNSYVAYRSVAARPARTLRSIQESLHEVGSLEAGATQVFEMSDVPVDSIVTCHVEITHNDEDGNLDLFMNSHGRFANFECTSESNRDYESCSVKVTTDKLYVFVHAISRVSEFIVVCDIDGDVLNV